MGKEQPQATVIPIKHSAGPHGLGDPEDKSLRKVEIEVMIPKKMRDVARVEKCFEEVKQFSQCCRNNNILMVVSCRNENSALKECLGIWYNDDAFKARCTKEYLDERSEYRRTGIKNEKKTRLPVSM